MTVAADPRTTSESSPISLGLATPAQGYAAREAENPHGQVTGDRLLARCAVVGMRREAGPVLIVADRSTPTGGACMAGIADLDLLHRARQSPHRCPRFRRACEAALATAPDRLAAIVAAWEACPLTPVAAGTIIEAVLWTLPEADVSALERFLARADLPCPVLLPSGARRITFRSFAEVLQAARYGFAVSADEHPVAAPAATVADIRALEGLLRRTERSGLHASLSELLDRVAPDQTDAVMSTLRDALGGQHRWTPWAQPAFTIVMSPAEAERGAIALELAWQAHLDRREAGAPGVATILVDAEVLVGPMIAQVEQLIRLSRKEHASVIICGDTVPDACLGNLGFTLRHQAGLWTYQPTGGYVQDITAAITADTIDTGRRTIYGLN